MLIGMIRRILVFLIISLGFTGLASADDVLPRLDQANEDYAKHNYRAAAQAYGELLALDALPETVSRDELIFRRADAEWRNLASTNQSDREALEPARRALENLAETLSDEAKGARRPQLWASIQESLGDSYWIPEQFRNWSQAWKHYPQALAWWAGSTELDDARERYLGIVFRAARPPEVRPYFTYGYAYGNWIDFDVLRNALRIAQSPSEKAQANFLLGMSARTQGGERAMNAGNYFQAALVADPQGDWRDDALFHYAQWAAQSGGSHFNENGDFVHLPDYALAVKLYRQFLDEFNKGESRYWNQVERQLERLTERELRVLVNENFLPQHQIAFNLHRRNLDSVELAIYPIDPANDLRTDNSDSPLNVENDDARIDVGASQPVWRQTRPSEAQPYAPENTRIEIDAGLDAGAYVIQAQSGGETAQALLVVTRNAITLLRDDDEILAWVTDAITGEPVADAPATLLLGRSWWRDGERYREWINATSESAPNGLAKFTAESFPKIRDRQLSHFPLMVAVSQHHGQYAIAEGRFYNRGRSGEPQWKVYAFTDRPAYRPGDAIHWKATARHRLGAENWQTPAGEQVFYRVTGPRGAEIASGVMTLNDYGSMWGELAAATDWALGMYQVEFRERSEQGDFIGRADLFRLEEYKLPEFKVSIAAANDDGESATAYRLGDEVKIAVTVDYYFGGAVPNAEVHVIVRESPYHHSWRPPSPYPWYFRDRHGDGRFGGGGREIVRKTMQTDANGRAAFTLETDGEARHDLEYAIEARVIDESRREVSGQAKIRATRQPYFVYVHPERTLYRPGEEAAVTIKALNANDDPVAVEGRVRLTRETWREVWRGPAGEEISGEAYRQRQREQSPASGPLDPTPWRRIAAGYEVEEIAATTLRTNEDGEATYAFTPEQTGYYRVSWVSQPERSAPVKADAAVWVADDATLSIGYHGDLKIVADEDAFREGRPAPVMLTTAEAGRWVLFSVQADELLDAQVVQLEGNVKLLNYDVTEDWVPNVWLQANAIWDLQAHADRQEIITPPEKHFLDVTVESNAEDYAPRTNGQVTITTRNNDGQPVAAEVALAVFDEAVLAIQPSLAPDPREFFYGAMRPDAVTTNVSTYWRAFRRPDSTQELALSESESNRWNSSLSGGSLATSVAGEADMSVHSRSAVGGLRAVAAPAAMAAPPAPPAADGFASREASKVAAEEAEPSVVVRSDFRATAFWRPAIQTNENGQAIVTVEFPDSLTTWNLEARANGLPAAFGEGQAAVKTRLPLIARLQTPRFLVTTDEVTFSGVLTNNTGQPIEARATLAIEGGLALQDQAAQPVTVPANGSTRADWTVQAQTAGDAKITLSVQSPRHADAMECTIPVFEHGIDQFLAQSGKMTTSQLDLAMDLPKFRQDGAALELYLAPSIATTMLDVLPYLAKYPYGCTEQTMSRFLPAVVVAGTLNQLGVDAESVMNQTFGGIETTTPGEVVDPHPARKEGDGDIAELDAMVAAGLQRLRDFQHPNGGWGWWKTGRTDPFMSAYVTWGLTLAHDAGRDVDPDMIAQARNYLGEQLVEFETQLDLQAWLLHALAAAQRNGDARKPDKFEARAFANLWKNRDQLNAYTRALTALSAHWLGFGEEARMLADNLANGVILDEAPQSSVLNPAASSSNPAVLPTAHWGEDGIHWRWSDGGVEATAFALQALVTIRPGSELIEPAMNWLVKNRRGAQWSNTRDSAIVVLALNAYLAQSGELEANGEYLALVNGEEAGSISITPDTLFQAPRKLSIADAQLQPGETTITLQRIAGESPLYFSARFNFFSLEDPVTPAGNEVFVSRSYERVYPVETLLDGYAAETEPLENGGAAQSGDRITATLRIDAKNHLEYLLIEDLKPAGFEAVALQSGAPLYAREVRPGSLGHEDRFTGRERAVYQELRDRQIACFIDQLPQGIWEISYELRAETPGAFSALPVIAEAMYVPEIRANSAEIHLTVTDQP